MDSEARRAEFITTGGGDKAEGVPARKGLLRTNSDPGRGRHGVQFGGSIGGLREEDKEKFRVPARGGADYMGGLEGRRRSRPEW